MQLPSEVPLADSRLVIAREFRMWRYSLTCMQHHQDVVVCRSAQGIWQPLPSGSICHQTPARKMRLSAVWELQFLVSSMHIRNNDSCRRQTCSSEGRQKTVKVVLSGRKRWLISEVRRSRKPSMRRCISLHLVAPTLTLSGRVMLRFVPLEHDCLVWDTSLRTEEARMQSVECIAVDWL